MAILARIFAVVSALILVNAHLEFENRSGASSRASWSYDDVDNWATLYETCGGDTQSPINIITSSGLMRGGWGNIKFGNYDVSRSTKISNNGHGVVVSLEDENATPFISGGGLCDQYTFHSFHLHWGTDSSKGSEHLVDDKQYPAEIHFVHYNSKYGSISEAVTHSDGLAVIGVFVEVGASDNASFAPLVDGLASVAAEGQESTLASFPFSSLLPVDTTQYYRYAGSLTTPQCNEVVTWTVMQNAVEMSEAQLSEFRKVFGDNFRPPQEIGGRPILKFK